MNLPLLEVIQTHGKRTEGTCYCKLTPSLVPTGKAELKEGFFFLLVTNGTAQLIDENQTYELQPSHLVALTPSVRSTIQAMSSHFQAMILYLKPTFFDTLPDVQPLYEQLARYLGYYRLPVFLLENVQTTYLQNIFTLFSQCRDNATNYYDGILNHLCCFCLLQIADILSKIDHEIPNYARRSTDIFRLFKKTLMENYRQHHDIGFYAESLHISTTYLSRIVKHITGHTVRFHISELLCADARKLLECTDLDIKEIAEKLGFSDQSVFGKFFVKKTGVSPMKFRTQRERDKQNYPFPYI